jgi:transposase-like protein
MKELSVAEQRYQAVLAVISDGFAIPQVARKAPVSRQMLHPWLDCHGRSASSGW